MNIKGSFADCSSCPLLPYESAIADTNCLNDIRKTQIFFVAENPGKDEVAGGICEGITYPPGTPLIGKAGTIFRKVLNKNIKSEGIKYFITNTVLCCTIKPDGTTGNPEQDVIDRCKINLFKMMAICNPKLVVVMGTTPMKALGIEGAITKNQGNFFKFNNPECYKDFDVLVTVHPSYVARNGGLDTETGHQFERCFIKAIDFIKQRKSTIMASASVVSQKVDKPYMYRIPDKFYTNEYRLIDIQYVNYKKQLVFIFRDSQNKKVYYLPTPSENQYYWYESTEGHSHLVEKASDLVLKIGPYDSRNNNENCYESDRRIIDKHSVDYYLQSEGEPLLVKRNIVFFDIEIYLYTSLAFPSITDAQYPISMFSFAVDDGPVHVWLLRIDEEIDKNIDEIAKQFPNLRIFTDEKQMLTEWIKFLQEQDPDFVCGWNCVKAGSIVRTSNCLKRIENICDNDVCPINGQMKNSVYTGKKDQFLLTTKIFGKKLSCSGNHIIPIYTKLKSKYGASSTILRTRTDVKVSEICDIQKDYDVFVETPIVKNTNPAYTLREYLIENISEILKYSNIDFIAEREVRTRLRDVYYTKESFNREEYWHGKGYFEIANAKYWSFKTLLSKTQLVTITDLINQFKKYDKIRVYNGNIFTIDLNTSLDYDVLYVLGSIFTDGHFSNCDRGLSFCNTNDTYFYEMMRIFDKFRFKLSEAKYDKQWDNCRYGGMGINNLLGLLIPVIFNIDYKKSLSLQILSRFSFKQFMSFISGVIDGDGSICHNYAMICNYDKNGPEILSSLIEFNGIICSRHDNGVYIPNYENNKEFFNSLKLHHSNKILLLTECKKIKTENSKSKNQSKLIFSDKILLLLNKVESISDTVDMYDISTDNHYFICNGINVHNCNAFDWQYIFFRMKTLKMRTSSISKFDNVWCDGETKAEITGLVCLDLLWLYKNLTYTNEPSYSLKNIAQKVLGHGKKEFSGDLNSLYRKDIKTLIEYSFTDTKLLQELDDAKGHVALQDELRKAATTTHLGASSTIGLADGLFNYELKKQGLVMANAHHDSSSHKQTGNVDSVNSESEEDEHIVGAYVRQPVGGIYDWVIDFDYTSLYPSIICSFNIGPNTYVSKITKEEAYQYTYKRSEFLNKFSGGVIENPIYNRTPTKMSAKEFCDFIAKNNYIVTPSGCIFKNHIQDKSYFYNIIKKLFSQRKTYKKMMFECNKKQDKFNAKIFDNMQLSYKILMNSLYGVIAQKHFRFYNLDLASTVTISGQELIKFAGDHADKWMHDQTISTINPDFEKTIEQEKEYLRYCDTDSLFIWMKPYLESKKIQPTVDNIKVESSKIQEFLNKVILKEYIKVHNIIPEESMFDLKNELICKRYYSLNVKKKYALHVISQEGVDKDEIEVKGLEVRRSDFSDSTKEMLNKIISMILKTQEVSIIDIEKYIEEVRSKTLDLISKGDFSIFKTVAYTKSLEEYKTIPQAIRGMQIWNILEYDHFRVGMRGILVPIRGLDMFKAPDRVKEAFNEKLVKQFNVKKDFTVIVVPEELQKIPIYYAIDVNKVLEFSIYDRVNLLLEPLYKSVSTEQLKWDF